MTKNRFAISFAFLRLTAIGTITAGALILTACGKDNPDSTTGSIEGRSKYETADDHALGNPNSPITVVEYASVTCGHCANWHETVWPDFKKKYVDTNKIRFVYREFPTPPVDLANAGHLLANCAPEDKYFDIIGVQFDRQRQILTSQDPRAEYVAMAKSVGMSEDDFDKCMQNQEEMDRLQSVIDGGINAGVEGTPTFFINGKKAKVYVLEDFDKAFAKILGEPVPVSKDDKTSDKADGKARGE